MTITLTDKYMRDSIEIEFRAYQDEWNESTATFFEVKKVFYLGRDITNRIEFSDRNKKTDYWTLILETINSNHN